MENINQKVKRLSTLYKGQKMIADAKKNLIDSIIPQDIKKAIEEVEVEFASALDALMKEISDIEKEIKKDVVDNKESVREDGITVAYCGGKTTWDNELLEDYIKKHPKSKIAKAKKEPKPYASIYR